MEDKDTIPYEFLDSFNFLIEYDLDNPPELLPQEEYEEEVCVLFLILWLISYNPFR